LPQPLITYQKLASGIDELNKLALTPTFVILPKISPIAIVPNQYQLVPFNSLALLLALNQKIVFYLFHQNLAA